MAAAAPLVVWCGLVTNQYYAPIVTRGNVPNWSDAIESLRQKLAETPSGGILSLDWGIMRPLCVLGRGDLPLKFWNADRNGRPVYRVTRYRGE